MGENRSLVLLLSLGFFVLARRNLKKRQADKLKTSSAELPPTHAVEEPATVPRVSPPPVSSDALRITEDVIKSATDARSYRHITLPNGLACLLISEPALAVDTDSKKGNTSTRQEEEEEEEVVEGDGDTRVSAAALSVRVGGFSDPPELPGLAHFCEHMLFMGTKTYPDENGWEAYISKHGGQSNAYTDTEHTVYHFDIHPKYLPKALHRFSQFFTHPLFKASTTKREIRAVNSEFMNCRLRDYQRYRAVLHASARPDHPFSKFTWGNLQSLETIPKQNGVDVREELLKFHARYYSSDAMRLVVLDTRPLDELQDIVCGLFSEVRNLERPLVSFADKGLPFDDTSLGHFYNIVAVKDRHSLGITWALPDQFPLWRTKPTQYISHILGHEGPGSLFSMLKARGWATSLCAGTTNGGNQQNSSAWLTEVSINLSDEGFEHRFEIVGAVFQLLALMRKTGIIPLVWEEMKALGDMAFRFEEQSEPMDTVEELSLLMQLYPAKHVLSGETLFYDFDADETMRHLEMLTPANAQLHFLSKSFHGKTDCITPWFKTPYAKHKIPQNLLTEWADPTINPLLMMPGPNPYIPTSFDLVRPTPAHVPPYPASRDMPVNLSTDEFGAVWHAPERMFLLPRGNVQLLLRSPICSRSCQSGVLTHFTVSLLLDLLAEPIYDASVAELCYNMTCLRTGIEIKVGGLSDKMYKLTSTILEYLYRFPELLDTPAVVSRFVNIKEKLCRDYRHSFYEPASHARYERRGLLVSEKFTLEEALGCVEATTHQMLSNFISEFLQCMHVTLFTHGNTTPEQTLAFWESVKNMKGFTPYPNLTHTQRCVRLPLGTVYSLHSARNPKETNSAVENCYYVGWNDAKTTAQLTLLTHLMAEPCFDQLRTKEQIGYDVSCGTRDVNNIMFIAVLIQSEAYSAKHVDERIEAFLHQFYHSLKRMSSDEFKSNVEGLLLELCRPENNLTELTDRFWMEMCRLSVPQEAFVFNRAHQDAASIKAVTQDELLCLFERCVLGRDRAHVVADPHPASLLHWRACPGGGKEGGTKAGETETEGGTREGQAETDERGESVDLGVDEVFDPCSTHPAHISDLPSLRRKLSIWVTGHKDSNTNKKSGGDESDGEGDETENEGDEGDDEGDEGEDETDTETSETETEVETESEAPAHCQDVVLLEERRVLRGTDEVRAFKQAEETAWFPSLKPKQYWYPVKTKVASEPR